jgi:uncharacterized protein YndB with AHSA1/START domain
MATNAERPIARAVADLEQGEIVAAVELEGPPERVFRALTTSEVCEWWVRPGVFDTREWSADVRPGGLWRAGGIGGGRPYTLEGEFVEVHPPRLLAHTWRAAQEPAVTTVRYRLDASETGTRLFLRHTGFTQPATCANTSAGWEASFNRLAELLLRTSGGRANP